MWVYMVCLLHHPKGQHLHFIKEKIFVIKNKKAMVSKTTSTFKPNIKKIFLLLLHTIESFFLKSL